MVLLHIYDNNKLANSRRLEYWTKRFLIFSFHFV